MSPGEQSSPTTWQRRLKPTAALLAAAFAFLKPAPPVRVQDWAAAKRYLAPEVSPLPGRWHNDTVPFLTEIMDCLSPSHPASEVTFVKSHQVAGTEGGLNFFGTVVDAEPGPMLIVLPTLDEAKKYNELKLTPAIEATPALREKVREQTSRGKKGSTAYRKRFPGGYAQLTGANTPAGLQMLSIRYLIKEEISQWPDDVGGLGDPDAMADKRTTAFSAIKKIFNVSVPGIKGICKISKKYDASDKREYHVPCPQCGELQVLRWENLRYEETVPHRAHFQCVANGCVIEHHHKMKMLRAGRWIASAPGPGRQPGFWIWQAYSPFVSWDECVADWIKSRGFHSKEKDHVRQVRGLPFEELGEQPDHLKLFARREDFKPGRLPVGALFITAGIDTQDNRLEWAVWAWGIGKTRWLIDRGVIKGEPSSHLVWRELDQVLARTYPDWQGKTWPIEAACIDTGGHHTQDVYRYVRPRQADGRLLAIKGMPGHLTPALGTPTTQDVNDQGRKLKGGVLLWPVGVWSLKSELYASLRKTIAGPDADGAWPIGAARLSLAVDEEYLKQLTAEHLVKRTVRGVDALEWVKVADRANEALDCAVYAAAAAVHVGIDRLEPEDWQKIAATRGAKPEQAQADMAALWAPALDTAPVVAQAEPVTEEAAVPAGDGAGEGDWLGGRVGDDWLN